MYLSASAVALSAYGRYYNKCFDLYLLGRFMLFKSAFYLLLLWMLLLCTDVTRRQYNLSCPICDMTDKHDYLLVLLYITHFTYLIIAVHCLQILQWVEYLFASVQHSMLF